MCFAILFSLMYQNDLYARNNSGDLDGVMYARRGSDDRYDDHDHHYQYHDRHGRGRGHRDYRSKRYYPEYYYYKKRVYCVPLKKEYYFYDVFPERIYYFEGERDRFLHNREYLAISSIANMGAQGIPDDVIIEEIRRTNSVYFLSSDHIEYLRRSNVADSVIDCMRATNRAK